MTVNMGTVWDRASEFLGGRARGYWLVALVAIFVPRAIANIAQLTAATGGKGMAPAIVLVASLVALWGQLAIVAQALDPAGDAAAARAAATRGYGRALLAMAILFVAILVLVAPLIGMLVASGVDLTAMMSGGTQGIQPDMSGGMAAGFAIYVLAILVVGLFAGARLIALYPVVLAEGRGAGAIARSFAVTRGLTWKLVGVLLLFGIVFAVAGAAARSVAGVIAGLLFPASGDLTPASVTGAVAGALVTTAFAVVVAAFSAKLYRAVVAAPAGAAEIA